ncbi:hypothetical protein BD413DRAFT_254063 [Trametes elegans]|nr:hypothetical protein BD413DRAFT_254063 [Trametes elegans]
MRVVLPRPRLFVRAFGDPFGGCTGFFPPFGGFGCTEGSSTSTTNRKTTSTLAPPPPTKTSVVTSATVVTSIAVVTSGSTVTTATTFTSATTLISVPSSVAITSGPVTSTSIPGAPSSPDAAREQTTFPTATQTTVVPVYSTSQVDISVVVPSTTTLLSASTVFASPSPQKQPRRMSPGEIAAICIATLSVLVLCVLIWRAWRKRNRTQSTVVGNGDFEDRQRYPATPPSSMSMSMYSAHAVRNASPEMDARQSVSDVRGLEEKLAEEYRHPIGDAMSPISSPSTALSTHAMLNSTPVFSPTTYSSMATSPAISNAPLALPTGTSAAAVSPAAFTPPATSPFAVAPTSTSTGLTGPPTAQSCRFRSAWDDPPPTPEFRQVSLRPSGTVASPTPQPHSGGDPMDTSACCDHLRDTIYSGRIPGQGEEDEADVDRLPEYSRY